MTRLRGSDLYDLFMKVPENRANREAFCLLRKTFRGIQIAKIWYRAFGRYNHGDNAV